MNLFAKIMQSSRSIFIIYCIVSTFVFLVWIWGADSPTTSLNGDPSSTLIGLIDGTANKPYVHRVLIPILTRMIIKATPPSVINFITDNLKGLPKFQKEALRLGWDTSVLPFYLVALALAYVCLLMFPFVLLSLFKYLYQTEEAIANFIPVLVLLGLPPFFLNGTHYIYDFPALLFFNLSILLLLKKRWILFYIIFVLGCLNKETMILQCAVFLMIYIRQMKLSKILSHMIGQIILFVIIKGIISFIYKDNLGNSLQFHLYANIHLLLLPYTLNDLFITILLVILVIYDLRQKHPFLRLGVWLLLPFSVLMLLFGCIGEVRALYEIYPIVALLMIHTIVFSFMKFPYRLQHAIQ